MLRADGVLLPFAEFDGDDWSTPWPTAIEKGESGAPSELPSTLDAIPDRWWGGQRPGPWTVWPRDARKGVPFKLSDPAIVPVGEVRRLGIRTDYTAAPKPDVKPEELPYPKIGLAVAGQVTVQPIPGISLQVPSSRELVGRIRPDIEAAEERAINALQENAGWVHPFERQLRRKFFPVLEAIYTTPLAEEGNSVSYVEIAKRYPPLPADKGCGLETFISGWVYQLRDEVRLRSDLRANVTYCDRARASYMLPLGAVTLDGRTHWLFQMSGHDHEWYVAAEITPGRVRPRAEYHAGGTRAPTR